MHNCIEHVMLIGNYKWIFQLHVKHALCDTQPLQSSILKQCLSRHMHLSNGDDHDGDDVDAEPQE